MTDYRKTLIVEADTTPPPTGFEGYHSVAVGPSWSEAHDVVQAGNNIFVCGVYNDTSSVAGFILKLDLNLNIVASIDIRSADGYGLTGIQGAIFHASNGDLYTAGLSSGAGFGGRVPCIFRFDTDLNLIGKQDFFLTGQSTITQYSYSLNLAEYNGRIYAPFVVWGAKDNAFLASVELDMTSPQVHAQYAIGPEGGTSVVSNGSGNFVFSCDVGHVLFNSSFVAQAASNENGRNHCAALLSSANYVLSSTNTSGLFGLGITVVDQSFTQLETLRISYANHTYADRGRLSETSNGRVLCGMRTNVNGLRLPILQPVTLNPITAEKNIQLYDPLGTDPNKDMNFESSLELSNGLICAVGEWNPNGYANEREAVVCTFANNLDYADGTTASCDANTAIQEITTGSAAQSPTTTIPTQSTEVINAVNASTIEVSSLSTTSVGPCAWSPP